MGSTSSKDEGGSKRPQCTLEGGAAGGVSEATRFVREKKPPKGEPPLQLPLPQVESCESADGPALYAKRKSYTWIESQQYNIIATWVNDEPCAVLRRAVSNTANALATRFAAGSALGPMLGGSYFFF